MRRGQGDPFYGPSMFANVTGSIRFLQANYAKVCAALSTQGLWRVCTCIGINVKAFFGCSAISAIRADASPAATIPNHGLRFLGIMA